MIFFSSSSSKARQSSSLALSRPGDGAIAAIPLKRKGIASQGKAVRELLISNMNEINVSHFNFITSNVKKNQETGN